MHDTMTTPAAHLTVPASGIRVFCPHMVPGEQGWASRSEDFLGSEEEAWELGSRKERGQSEKERDGEVRESGSAASCLSDG